MAYFLPLLICLIPFSWLLTCDPDVEPKAQYRRFFAWFMTLLILASAVTIVGGLHVLNVLQVPTRFKLLYCVVLGTFWIACVIKNKRELPRLFATLSAGKPKAPDDELA